MNESGLVVNLIGYPAIAMKVAQRAARKKFGDAARNGQIPDDRLDDAQDYMDRLLLGQSITSIDDVASRSPMVLPARDVIGEALMESLPISQYARLLAKWKEITTSDQIGQAATDEPGF